MARCDKIMKKLHENMNIIWSLQHNHKLQSTYLAICIVTHILQNTILQNTYSTWKDQLITDLQSSSAYIHTTNPATVQENIQYTDSLSDLEIPQTKSSYADVIPLEPDQNVIIQKSIEGGDPTIISSIVRFIKIAQ